jgi:ligand-binding SRPBCC domain-containing protein
MARSITLTRTSRLPAPPDVVWRHATSMPSVNREMGPWLLMTYPAEARERSLGDAAVVLGEPLFTSWILFLGLVPVERMRVTIVELEPGRRFVERSPPLLLRSWRHERSVEPSEEGCVVTDVVTAEPPFAWFSPVVGFVVGRFFTHRHDRLRRIFAARGRDGGDQ